MASLTMGVADFPIEIFRAVKNKNQLREEGKAASASASSTDTPTQYSQSDSEPALDEIIDPQDDSASESKQPASEMSVPSTKNSYESTGARSSVDNAAVPGTPLSSTSSHERGGSLKEALRGKLSRSRSTSRDRGFCRSNSTERRPGSRNGSRSRTPQQFDPSKLTLENAIGASKGMSRIVGAGMKSPMDFTLGLARGFHNAPKLYGDDTVRPQEKVTDFQSGLRAAGKVS
jgi:hypothetical protein